MATFHNIFGDQIIRCWLLGHSFRNQVTVCEYFKDNLHKTFARGRKHSHTERTTLKTLSCAQCLEVLNKSLSIYSMFTRCQARHRVAESSWNVMAHSNARKGKWRGNWRMEWVASTLHTTSEHGVSSITTADAHTSAASSRLNWRPRRIEWTVRFAARWNLVSARVPSHFKRSLTGHFQHLL